MQAIVIDEFGGPEKLRVAERPDPKLPPDGILIRVHAAGVNPVDAKLRAGALDGAFPHHFPLVPGWDAAGTVEQVGPAVTLFEPGDEAVTYCRKDVVEEGAYAELLAVRASHAAHKPEGTSFEEAAGLPLAGLTACQALFDVLELQAGETVLVHGASGGVGSFAVQLARIAGAHVIAVASAANHDHLRELGADETIDYHDGEPNAQARERHAEGIEAVLDLVGGETQDHAVDALAPGGRLVSIVQPPDAQAFAERDLRASYHFVAPDGVGLRTLGALVTGGRLEVPVTATLPLEEAAEAHRRIEEGHTRGKLVLIVP